MVKGKGKREKGREGKQEGKTWWERQEKRLKRRQGNREENQMGEKGREEGKRKGKREENLIFFPRERWREGLIFFTSEREGGGELKRELDFFPASLKHAFSLLVLSLNLKDKTEINTFKKIAFISISRNEQGVGFFFDFFSVVHKRKFRKKRLKKCSNFA